MPDLPSGIVTFLLTDIEGSTALWERDRDAMTQVVERHLQLLRVAIDAHGDVLFKTGVLVPRDENDDDRVRAISRRGVRGPFQDSPLPTLGGWPSRYFSPV
jgi:class 3 adenylate cyclase